MSTSRILLADDHPVFRMGVNVESEQVVRDCLQDGVRGWVFKSDGSKN